MKILSRLASLQVVAFLFFVSVGGGMALAQQDANNQEQPIMTPASGSVEAAANGPTGDSKQSLAQLYLNTYEVAAGDQSTCPDKHCLNRVIAFKHLRCAINACNGTDNSKESIKCFDKIFDKYSIGEKEQISVAICSMIKSPNVATRQALMSHLSGGDINEEKIVELEGYIGALKGSALSCENTIKNYVGAYGPKWTSDWYKDLSGCRILAHERTLEQEEKDFYTWFGVVQGSGSCSDIMNTDMRDACNAPGATSPVPTQNDNG